MRYASFGVLTLNGLAVVSAVALSPFVKRDPFSEGGFLTVFSGLQLLLVAYIAVQVKKHSPRTNTSIIWTLIAVGFIFLTADEFFKIHENLDWLIHEAFNLQETGLTDRIDDILIGLYGVIGLAVLFVHFDELRPYRKAFPFFIVGFFLLFAMVTLDIITNRNDILPLIFNYEKSFVLQERLAQVEDSLKVFAEGFFILAFYMILQMAKKISILPLAKSVREASETFSV